MLVIGTTEDEMDECNDERPCGDWPYCRCGETEYDDADCPDCDGNHD